MLSSGDTCVHTLWLMKNPWRACCEIVNATSEEHKQRRSIPERSWQFFVAELREKKTFGNCRSIWILRNLFTKLMHMFNGSMGSNSILCNGGAQQQWLRRNGTQWIEWIYVVLVRVDSFSFFPLIDIYCVWQTVKRLWFCYTIQIPIWMMIQTQKKTMPKGKCEHCPSIMAQPERVVTSRLTHYRTCDNVVCVVVCCTPVSNQPTLTPIPYSHTHTHTSTRRNLLF